MDKKSITASEMRQVVKAWNKCEQWMARNGNQSALAKHLGLNRSDLNRFLNGQIFDANWECRLQRNVTIGLKGFSRDKLFRFITKIDSTRSFLDWIHSPEYSSDNLIVKDFYDTFIEQVQRVREVEEYPSSDGLSSLNRLAFHAVCLASTPSAIAPEIGVTAGRVIRSTLLSYAAILDRRKEAKLCASDSSLDDVQLWVSRLLETSRGLHLCDGNEEDQFSSRCITGLAGYCHGYLGLMAEDRDMLNQGFKALVETAMLDHLENEGHWANALTFAKFAART